MWKPEEHLEPWLSPPGQDHYTESITRAHTRTHRVCIEGEGKLITQVMAPQDKKYHVVWSQNSMHQNLP